MTKPCSAKGCERESAPRSDLCRAHRYYRRGVTSAGDVCVPRAPAGYSNCQTGTGVGLRQRMNHLVPVNSRGGTSGPTVCGLSRFDSSPDAKDADIPGWSMGGGGLSGTDIEQVRCEPCWMAGASHHEGARPMTEQSGEYAPVDKCGVCAREAEVMATVPMCGERPRYPLCHECLTDLTWSEYAEEVVPL